MALVDLQAGSLHLLEWVLTKDVATVKGNQALALDELPWAGQTYFLVGYNTEAPPFNDLRVRQAASMAIDREGMNKALGFGVGAPTTTWTGPLGRSATTRALSRTSTTRQRRRNSWRQRATRTACPLS